MPTNPGPQTKLPEEGREGNADKLSSCPAGATDRA